MVINGYRFCDHCVRMIGGSAKAWGQPGIFNWRSGIRHLNRSKRDLNTLCGLDTNNDSWELPWREIERRREQEWRRYERAKRARASV